VAQPALGRGCGRRWGGRKIHRKNDISFGAKGANYRSVTCLPRRRGIWRSQAVGRSGTGAVARKSWAMRAA
jgi:hypothetical protein